MKDLFLRVFRGRNSCRCFYVELLKLPSEHRYSVDIFFHILFYQEYWVLMESKIRRKPVPDGVRIVALMNRLNKQSLLYSCIVGKDLFSRLF